MATASRQHLLHALNFVCSSLHVLGVTGLTPETIRQAKFGGPVEAVFGRALHDLVVLSLAGFPESAHTLLQNFWSQIDYVPQRLKVPAEGRQLVSVYLQQHGYARASFCFADAHSGSRMGNKVSKLIVVPSRVARWQCSICSKYGSFVPPQMAGLGHNLHQIMH
ncbi:hypothetical protein WJX79_008101 [Trebouxia sp. C0005]